MADVGHGQILIVDDVAFMRRMLSGIIKSLGYEVAEADSAAKAMELIQARTPSLIFLDLVMPDMDGIALCKWIRAHEATAHTPVVVCTAQQDRKSVEQAIHAGATDLLLKPVDKTKVKERIRKHLHAE